MNIQLQHKHFWKAFTLLSETLELTFVTLLLPFLLFFFYTIQAQ